MSPEGVKSAEDLREIYSDLAPRLSRLDWLNRLVTGRHRERLFGRARGRVLDVACGTGTNLRYLPAGIEYVGVDLSPDMLQRARDRFRDRLPADAFREMDATRLQFDDGAFDTVISSLSTCTFPDPDAVLGEMGRVCRPDGRILLLEHGRSDAELLARFQDWRADAHYEKHGCRWNQDPVEVVSGGGLRILDRSDALLGILTSIEAAPPDAGHHRTATRETR